MVATRRALLGAGALLLVGCGPPDEPEIVPKDVLEQQLRVTATTAQALDGTPAMRDGADARVRLIAGAYEDLGGDWEAVARDAPENRDALAAVRAELSAHVQAVGLLLEPEYRELFAAVIASAAADEAALAPARDLTAFPGTP